MFLPRGQSSGSEIGERTWRSPGSEFGSGLTLVRQIRSLEWADPGQAGSEFGEKTGLNPGSAGSEFGERKEPNPSLAGWSSEKRQG